MDNKQQKVEEAVRTILEAYGEDPNRPGLKETPNRVYRMFNEILSSTTTSEFEDYKLFPSAVSQDQMIIVRDIPFYSLCEHHMLPFFGKATVAYYPDHNQIIGLSKIPRLVNFLSQKLNVQEELTNEIGKEIERILEPEGVAVTLTARHLCMEMRGVKTHNSQTTTTYYSGRFKEDPNERQEFLLRLNAE